MLVATVLKSGGDFTTEYVARLRDSLRGYDFVCLSDVDVPCERIPLTENLPGWWSKLELFKLTGKVFYLDLDTVVTGDIRDMVEYPHRFTALRDFGAADQLGTGVMAWEGDYSFLLHEFKDMYWNSQGDGHWLMRKRNRGELSVDYFQDLFPGRITSYKLHKEPGDIVCYHGKPRPHETGWAA